MLKLTSPNSKIVLCRDLTIFSVASSARTWVPGLEDLLEPHDALPDQVNFVLSLLLIWMDLLYI